jgi:oligopeptide transport system substrate-binding protein
VRGLRGCVAGLVSIALLVGACTVPPPEPPPEPEPTPEPVDAPEPDPVDERAGGTLRVGLSMDPLTLDPRFLAEEEGELVADALFDPLVRLDDAFEVVPAAAMRWTVSDDGRELTFRLREASFHDGTPVTAQDFVRSFNRIADGTADPPSFLAYLLAPVEGLDAAQSDGEELTGVEALDERTLRIRLSEPEPAFLTTLADPSLVPLPAVADEDPETFGEQPVGNGPFLMTEPREPDAFLRLRRNEEHHDPPLVDEVVLVIYPEDTTRDLQWDDLVQGQLQVAEVPPERREEAIERYGRSSDGYRGPGYVDGLTSTVYLYGFDTTLPPFDLPEVRRAISLAIDREALADDVLQGSRVAATAIVPPPIPGAQAGACVHCRHDPEAARAELDAAREALSAAEAPDPDAGDGAAEEGADAGETVGQDDGESADGETADEDDGDVGDEADAPPVLERLTLTHNRGRTHAAIAEAMAADIEAALGIEVELEAQDLQPFVQAVRRGEVASFRLGWDAGEPDPGAYLRPLFHSSQVGLDNLTRYADDEVDRLLDEARAAQEAPVAVAWYRQAERRILADAPVIPLLWYRHQRVIAPEVQDLTISPLGRMSLRQAWLDD